jgi:hypothetical protein
MRWEQGRQGGGYQKVKLFSCRYLDCYIIKFPAGYRLPTHVDEVVGKRHYRLNVLLRGEDAYQGAYIWKLWRFICFRSDQPHGTLTLTRVRTLLSFGWRM